MRTATRGEGRPSSRSAKAARSAFRRSGVTRCGDPVMANTLGPLSRSCLGGTTMSNMPAGQRGSWTCTTKVEPWVQARMQSANVTAMRPAPIHRSGQGGSIRAESWASMARGASCSGVGRRP